jgi:hypothetical protein
VCVEASTVLRAVAADFFFNCWYSEIPSNNRIPHIPRRKAMNQKYYSEILKGRGKRGDVGVYLRII